jgi:hypothetical protein
MLDYNNNRTTFAVKTENLYVLVLVLVQVGCFPLSIVHGSVIVYKCKRNKYRAVKTDEKRKPIVLGFEVLVGRSPGSMITML